MSRLRKHSQFRAGSGCFECKRCGKLTRDVDGNADVDMCPLCEAISGQENALSDNHGISADLGHCHSLKHLQSTVEALIAEHTLATTKPHTDSSRGGS